MELFTPEQRQQLLKNGTDRDKDHPPVVRLFMSNTACTWLISEIYGEEMDYAFGLCDLGMGFPELGYCYLTEMLDAENPHQGIKLLSDSQFRGNHPMSTYQAAARDHCRIIWDEPIIRRYSKKPGF